MMNFRNIFGTSSFWRLVPIPAAVAGLTIFLATERVEGFFCHATAMVVCIEMILIPSIVNPILISFRWIIVAGFRNADS